MSRYLVTYGLGESEREFATFPDALACYVDNIAARGGVKVWNLDLCDEASDGLNEVEREAVELADELHTEAVA